VHGLDRGHDVGGRGVPAGVSATGTAAITAGGAIATGLSAALGVGVGAIIRNQAGAITAVLALVYVAEPLLGFVPSLGPAIQQYGLGGLAAATTHTVGFPASAHLLGQPAAALILAGYATAVLLAGAALLRRRDIPT
jgi:ABC-2 type transport system permease protein